MGQIADDMVNGLTCSDCGMYFQDPNNKDGLYEHGYPVICRDCWQEYSRSERKCAKRDGMSCALVNTVR